MNSADPWKRQPLLPRYMNHSLTQALFPPCAAIKGQSTYRSLDARRAHLLTCCSRRHATAALGTDVSEGIRVESYPYRSCMDSYCVAIIRGGMLPPTLSAQLPAKNSRNSCNSQSKEELHCSTLHGARLGPRSGGTGSDGSLNAKGGPFRRLCMMLALKGPYSMCRGFTNAIPSSSLNP